MTYDRYGHLMPGSEAEAAGLLDAYLREQIGRDCSANCSAPTESPAFTGGGLKQLVLETAPRAGALPHVFGLSTAGEPLRTAPLGTRLSRNCRAPRPSA
jgi:hypothetical protein